MALVISTLRLFKGFLAIQLFGGGIETKPAKFDYYYKSNNGLAKIIIYRTLAFKTLDRMPKLRFQQPILQLEKRKGGYYYLEISANVVSKFEKGRSTRLKCEVDRQVSFSCGLNHLGDGNFFIIVAGRYLKSLGKELGDEVSFEIMEDPNPLGVEIPEVLSVLLEQDEEARRIFDAITDGKKRSLIYSIQKVKDIDKQVEMSLAFLNRQKLS